MTRDPAARPPLSYSLNAAERRSRRLRNVALAILIGALSVLFYVMTIAKMGACFFTRPI